METEATVRPTVKLTGEDGNVFNIIARCRRAARSQGWTDAQWRKFLSHLTDQSSYNRVIALVMERFHVE